MVQADTEKPLMTLTKINIYQENIMNFDTSVLRNDEKIIYTLRSLYSRHGYNQYKMSQFEEYDLYVKNKDFLISDRIITFTDTNGKLMALKPDVTLSIIKSSKDEAGLVQKLYYNENVYRAESDSQGFKEIMQSGLECIGDLTEKNISEVVILAAQSLKAISENSILEISHLGIIASIIEVLDASDDSKSGILRCINEKNTDTLRTICADEGISDTITEALCRLALLYVKIDEATMKITEILKPSGLLETNAALSQSVKDLEILIRDLDGNEIEDILRIDFSVTSDMKYYNGIVFSGFINGIPNTVLSGGQYDKLMKKIGRKSRALGFAVYLDVLERLEDIKAFDPTSNIIVPKEEKYLNVALPKGRLGEKVYEMFAKAGFECPSILENNRKLIFENAERKVRYFWAKPSDVQIYVERGAADIGVAGKDILLEYEPDIYELLDLNIGKCRMCVAAQKGFKDNPERTLKVATKFSNIARTYYSSIDRDIDIVHLNGSIEIAPILGLTDVIVDIVETGTTLKENNLEVVETIVPISARLIANKASYKFNSEQIMKIQQEISKMVR